MDGPFLFGKFCAADAMFTPVVSRLETFAIPVSKLRRTIWMRCFHTPAFLEWKEASKAEDMDCARKMRWIELTVNRLCRTSATIAPALRVNSSRNFQLQQHRHNSFRLALASRMRSSISTELADSSDEHFAPCCLIGVLIGRQQWFRLSVRTACLHAVMFSWFK